MGVARTRETHLGGGIAHELRLWVVPWWGGARPAPPAEVISAGVTTSPSQALEG